MESLLELDERFDLGTAAQSCAVQPFSAHLAVQGLHELV